MDVLFAELSAAGKGVLCIQLYLGKTGRMNVHVHKMGYIFKHTEIWGTEKISSVFPKETCKWKYSSNEYFILFD